MQSPHPRRMLNDAIRERSLSQLVAAMEMIKADPRLSSPQEFLSSILGRCVRHGSIDLVKYLLECEGAPVCWLVEHGARVTDREMELYEIFPQPAPLLETCAVRGSVETFRFLQSKRALLGHRTLHRAAGEAASFGADPFTFQEVHDEAAGDEARTRKERAEMLVFLVDEMKPDINAMDSSVPYRAYHWGTPLCYAAVKEKGVHVVRWLLEKGAQPKVETAQNVADAEMLAKLTGCTNNEKILRGWKQSH
ncbi:hypothetical protein FCOIX_5349 [Fusarium coicis]|nr:hypothetical protein FCOIX_5349 [Fusarium coicis]